LIPILLDHDTKLDAVDSAGWIPMTAADGVE
jgi:hypothetical protein